MTASEYRLFVYDSLMSGESEHHRLEGVVCLGAAQTSPLYSLMDLGSSVALVERGQQSIVGELYVIDRARLAQLDVSRQVPILFQRLAVTLADGSEAEAYVMLREQVRGRRRVAHGDYRKRFAPRSAPTPGPLATWAKARFKS